ncbi:MAG: hypothetical protein WC044_11950 [Crocinitomicaceae bacterium]
MIGSGAGLVLGLLAGLSVLAIPGFGFLYGAGAVVGAFAGFDIGMITGGIGTLLATAGLKEDVVDRLTAHLEEGYYLILVKGSLEEVKRAEKLLHTEGTHLDYFR